MIGDRVECGEGRASFRMPKFEPNMFSPENDPICFLPRLNYSFLEVNKNEFRFTTYVRPIII
jgi:hypothetical protein